MNCNNLFSVKSKKNTRGDQNFREIMLLQLEVLISSVYWISPQGNGCLLGTKKQCMKMSIHYENTPIQMY